jgi:hypothetical protein
MSRAPDELVTMRLADMNRVHPAQDNSHACSACGHQVGIYPSGQRALRQHPNMKIMCIRCAVKAPGTITEISAAPWPEIKAECDDSREVGKA